MDPEAEVLILRVGGKIYQWGGFWREKEQLNLYSSLFLCRSILPSPHEGVSRASQAKGFAAG